MVLNEFVLWVWYKTYSHETESAHMVRGNIVVRIEATYRQLLYNNVQTCIGYTLLYFYLKFDNYQNIILRVNNVGIFLAFDFCRFCVIIRFFHPRHNGQWYPTSKDFYTRSYPFHYFLILLIEKEPVFPVWMLSAQQGNYWYHFYNVFSMTRSLIGDWTRDLRHSKPALFH